MTVEPAPGQTPVFSTLYIRSTNKWVFNGIKVQSLVGTNNNRQPLVAVRDQGAALPTSNIVLTNMLVSSADPSVYATWTQAQWAANARIGISVKASGNGANTSCVSIVDSHITANHFGLEVFGDNMLVTGNEIDRFGDDGIDYGASNILITKNYIHDPMEWNIGAHMDGMQGYSGTPVPPAKTVTFKNVVIDSNKVIRQADPKLPFPTNSSGHRRLRWRLGKPLGDEQCRPDQLLLGPGLLQRTWRQDRQQHGGGRRAPTLARKTEPEISCVAPSLPSATRAIRACHPTT